ncbi:MAG TPA: carboxypeptidase-like regulatory domain-containing protein, partial [Candidatus Polarisedimenticolia bacterium]|nr:carboxypeptidase-like regulatory domain-containing protein [Candidatus Polarisedimenticolia bacterium]
NVSVPYDVNPTNGEITTALTVPPQMAIENMVGHYVFQVVSPTGRFSPVTASFAITNSALNQSLSGTVYSNGVPAPYAAVVAQDLQSGNTAGAVVADAGGHYFLTLVPGNYGLIAIPPNSYFNQDAAPSVILTNGMSSTNDLFTTNGTVTISGNVYDAGDSNAIGGLLIQLESGSLFTVVFTDTNGNYSARVSPGFWKITPTKERLARRAYLVSQSKLQVDATAGDVSGANAAVFKGNALFYGRVTDNLGHPFANVQMDASANDPTNFQSVYSAKGFSDTNGFYGVAVLGDLTNFWNCEITSGSGGALGNYVLNFFQSVTNAPMQTTLENFVALPVIGQISGHVQDSSGNPVTGVSLNAQNNGNYGSLDGSTDNSGNYSLSVAAGQWNVQFLTGGNDNDNLDQRGLADITGPHIVSLPPTNAVLNLTVFPTGTPFMGKPQRFSSTQFGFNINGQINVNYTVQVSTNLASTNWTTLLSLQLTNNPFPVVDVNATNSRRFYRIIKN